MNIKRIGKAIMVLLLATPALSSMELMAQNLKMPTLEDLLPGGATYRIAENLPGLQWWGDVCIKPGIDSLFAVNPKNGKETLLTTREKVNKVLNSLITPTETTATPGHKGNKVQHFYNTEFPWPDKPYMLIKLPARYIVYDFEKDEFVKGLPQAGERNGANIDYTPEGGHIAYTVKNNLFVDNKAVTEEPEGIVCGQSVHRNEFGIGKGTFWSPQGNLLAFYRMNESMVTPYPLVDITPRIALVDKIRYPMAGMLSHQVTVGIYNPDTQKTVYLNTGDPTNRYFTNISWAPDGKSLYLIELNRDQNHAKLCRYNSETGELMSTLIEETHPKYVEPQQPILFLPWDHTQFIYQSQKDGYNHLYLYNTDGKLIKQLTKGEWLVQNILGFNARKKEVIIASTEVSPLQSNLYKVNVNTGKRTPLDNSKGVHNGILSASGNYIIDRYSTPDTPRKIEITNTQNKKSVSLLTAKNPYEGFVMPAIETGREYVESELYKSADSPESILKEASGVISRLTGCTAVTTTPSGEESRIHRIRFVQTGSHTAMAVVIASNGIIKTKLFRCDFLLNPELLTVFDKAFNEIFSGMKLSSVNRPFIQTAAARLGELSMFTPGVLVAIMEACETAKEVSVYLSGVTKPLFMSDVNFLNARNVMEFLNNRHCQIRGTISISTPSSFICRCISSLLSFSFASTSP